MNQELPIQVVIPMAGIGSRFTSYGFKTNKYLLPINTDLVKMIEVAVLSLGIHVPCKYYFIINEEKGRDQYLRDVLDDIAMRHKFDYMISSVDHLTEGPASTVYHIHDLVDMSCPMIISNSDQVLSWSFDAFLEKCRDTKYDGCLLTYHPDYPLKIGDKDKHSFVRLDEEGEIVECAEKIVLSNKAIVGTHYFAYSRDFFEAYEDMVRKNIRAPNGEFYISLAYESMLQRGKKISYYDLNPDKEEYFFPVGEPEDYFRYLYKRGKYQDEKIERIEFSLRNSTVLFSWYSNTNENVQIIQERNIGEQWIEIELFKEIFILLEGEAYVQLEPNGKMEKMNKYDVTNGDMIRVDETCKYISILVDMPDDTKKGLWSIDSFFRGWFLGNFQPSIYKKEEFEVGLLHHPKDDKWDFHYHKAAEETNVLIKGKMMINGKIYQENDVFKFPKNQISCPIFLEDSYVLCIKEPSIPGDKYCI